MTEYQPMPDGWEPQPADRSRVRVIVQGRLWLSGIDGQLRIRDDRYEHRIDFRAPGVTVEWSPPTAVGSVVRRRTPHYEATYFLTTTTSDPAAVPHTSAWERYEATVQTAWAETSDWARAYLKALPAHHPETVAWLRGRGLPADQGPRQAVAYLRQFADRRDAAWARYMDEAVTS